MKNINKKFLLCAKTPHNLMLHGVNVGDPAEIRTPDTLLKRQVLCRLSYWICLLYTSLKVEQITADEMDNLSLLYKQYNALGGNGTIAKLMERVGMYVKIIECDCERSNDT